MINSPPPNLPKAAENFTRSQKKGKTETQTSDNWIIQWLEVNKYGYSVDFLTFRFCLTFIPVFITHSNWRSGFQPFWESTNRLTCSICPAAHGRRSWPKATRQPGGQVHLSRAIRSNWILFTRRYCVGPRTSPQGEWFVHFSLESRAKTALFLLYSLK